MNRDSTRSLYIFAALATIVVTFIFTRPFFMRFVLDVPLLLGIALTLTVPFICGLHFRAKSWFLFAILYTGFRFLVDLAFRGWKGAPPSFTAAVWVTFYLVVVGVILAWATAYASAFFRRQFDGRLR
jgi:hypothetical protein